MGECATRAAQGDIARAAEGQGEAAACDRRRGSPGRRFRQRPAAAAAVDRINVQDARPAPRARPDVGSADAGDQ